MSSTLHTADPYPAQVTDAARLGTVLGVWAHPDDEAFLSAGLMAAARDAGNRVVCVTATMGEHGTGDPVRWPPDRLGPVRAAELSESLGVLGVSEHHFLGIVDGTCADQPFDTVVERIGAIIDDVRPDTIVTFGPDGMTGHEDHQTVSAWTTAARRIAAPHARLLYATTTAEFVDRWRPVHDRLDVFLVDGLPLRTPSDALGVELRLTAEVAQRKLAALRAQATQTAGMITALGEETLRDWWSVESFTDADTAPAATGWGTWQLAA
jgi:LmbE family N-acetylglucosaminyl deacetylase